MFPLSAERARRLLRVFDRAKRQGIDMDHEFLQQGEASGIPRNHPFGKALSDTAPDFCLCPTVRGEFVPVRNIETCALVYALTAARLLGAS